MGLGWFVFVAAQAVAAPLVCDANSDQVIDSRDIALINAARNKLATGADDPRDPDRNGRITVADARTCSQRCFLAGCALASSIPAPKVNAGNDQTLSLPYPQGIGSAPLNGVVTEIPASSVPTTAWSLLSGPAQVTFADAALTQTLAHFAVAGTYQLRLTVSGNGINISDDLQITVTEPLNTAPQLTPVGDRTLTLGSSLSLQVVASDSNPYDTLTFALDAAPDGVALRAPAMLQWTPGAGQIGTHPLTVRVTDSGGLADTQSFYVTVNNANQAPKLAVLANDTTAAQADYNKTLTATDADGDTLVYSLLAGPTGMVLSGNSLSWQPGAADVGSHAVKISVVDTSGAFDAAAFTVKVISNTAPVAVSDTYHVRVGETLTVPAAGVLTNDIDPDGSPLSALKLTDPDKGTLVSFSADGGFTYQAPAAFTPPGLNPGALWRAQINNTMTSLVVDINRDGTPDFTTAYYGGLIARDGRTGAELFNYPRGDGAQAIGAGCDNFAASSGIAGIAAGDVDDSGDISFVMSVNCGEYGAIQGMDDHFMAINGSQITAGKVNVRWLSERLTLPHPGAYATSTASAPASPPIRPQSTFSQFAGGKPTLARLTAGGGVKLLAHTVVGKGYGYYLGLEGFDSLHNPVSSSTPRELYAGCRAVTGLPADEGRLCRVTWILNAATGAVEQVLTAPNPNAEPASTNWRPWRTNPPIIADLDGDGQVEIISGGDVFRLVNGVWTFAWQSRFEPQSVAVADVDNDGQAEVVMYIGEYNDGLRTAADTGIVIYRHDGTLLRRLPLPVAGQLIIGAMTVADVDGDGAADILYPANGYLYAHRADGRLLWVFAVPDSVEPTGGFTPSPSAQADRTNTAPVQVYDLNLDGKPEVIMNADRRLFIIEGSSGHELWSVDNEGYGFDTSSLALADMDNDGHIDILSLSGSRWNCGLVPCLGSAFAISGSDHNWAPGPKVFNQMQFRPGAVNDQGGILYDASVRRDFRVHVQQGTVVDPRARQGTRFDYVANDGVSSSNTASALIEIEPTNSPPEITSLPPTGLLSVSPYTRPTYQITAKDADPGDTIHYELVATTHPFAFSGGRVNVNATTGVVDFYTGPCGSYGGPCDLGNVVVVVAAIDSQGARTEQSFVVTIGYNIAAVPNVVGQPFNSALETLQNATLRPRLLREQYAAQPAGTVIAQSPEAGAESIARGTSVGLTVSKGLQPVVVPNVVTQSESVAAAVLGARGFAVQVTRQYSDTVPAGQVIAQNPPAGNEVPPGNATITVSLGSGLIVRLHRNYTSADQVITLGVVAVDQDGGESPFPGAALSVTPAAMPYLGALPSADSSSIMPGLDTRGAFRVAATDTTTGRSASAEFVVAPPVAIGDADPFAQLSETINGVTTLLREARQAGLAGDGPTMRERTRAAVLLWRSFDQSVLRLSAPGAPELGFMPRVTDMAGFGVAQTPDDLINYASFKTVAEKLDALVMGLRKRGTSIIEVNNLFAEVSTAAEPLASMAPSEYGLIRTRSKHTLIVAHLIPDWMDALMNDLGGTIGMAPAPAAPDAPPLDAAGGTVGALDTSTTLLDRLAGYVKGIGDWFIKPAAASTLAEQLTIVALEEALDQINILKQIQDAAMKQAHQVGAMVVLASQIKASLHGQELVEVVAGSSLSLRLFHAPYSMIEGFNLESEDPRINNVMVIGPDVVASIPGIVDLARKTAQFKFDFTLPWKSANDARKLFSDGLKNIKELLEQAGKPVDGSWRQFTHTAGEGCIFSTAPSCVELIWSSGFISVYNLVDEDGNRILPLASPIIFLVHNPLDGQFYFATPPFIPYWVGQSQ
jgi:hypothetical protein